MPAEFGDGFVAEAFFSSDGMVGEIFGDGSDYGLLRAFIGLRDEVDFTFVGDFGWTGEFVTENGTGFQGDFYGGFEVVFRHLVEFNAETQRFAESRGEFRFFAFLLITLRLCV